MNFRKILYITDPISITTPSLSRYTEDLHGLFLNNSEILQVVFRKENIIENPRYRYAKPRLLNYPLSLLNHIFPRYAFYGIFDKIVSSNDIVHITSQLTDPIYYSSNAIVTIHDLIPFKNFVDSKSLQLINRLARRNTNFYIKHNYKIVTVSNYVKKDILKHFKIDEDNIYVIYPYVSEGFYNMSDKTTLRMELNLPVDAKLILLVGANTKRKNLSMVERVMNKLDDDFRLVRVGSPIGNSITFSNVEQQTLNKIYNACDLLYLPSLEEGFGYPIPEAFTTDLPVVASNIDVFKETAGDAAVLVGPNILEENIEGIHNAYENANYYAIRGKERAKMFTKENAAKKLLSLYDSLFQ